MSSQTSPDINPLPSNVTDDKTIYTLIDRRSPKRSEVVHVNNRFNPRIALWLFIGVGLLLGTMYVMGGQSFSAPKISTSVPGSKPIGLVFSAPTEVPTVIPTPSPVVVVVTVVPSPLPSLTPGYDVWLSIRVYWPRTAKGWNGAKTITGLDPQTLDGFGAACPSEFVLGSGLLVAGALDLLRCVDRSAGLGCVDAVCSIIVYSSKVGDYNLQGLHPARYLPPSKIWSTP